MNDLTERSGRIVRNTVLLYLRTFITIVISLYTSRIVLNALGVEDYGIYNVVGGIVILFNFLSNSMSTATQRFLSYEMGCNNAEQLARTFQMSVNIHLIIAVLTFIVAVPVGLWVIDTQLVLPEGRVDAARWVLYFTVMAFVVTVIGVPYNASIVANERMGIFAWVSLVEAGLKLLMAYMLLLSGFDKLILYAVLMFFVALIVRLFYGVYCSLSFSETRFKIYWENTLFIKLTGFSAWNSFGTIAFVLSLQGVNIVLNMFFGPVVNAARGIAYQVQGAVNGFVLNIQMAMNPQIVKSYAEGNLDYMHQLIFRGAKFSFFMLLVMSLPILLETEVILGYWLRLVPEYAVLFTQLVIINALIDSVSGPLKIASQASGNIKIFQAVVGSILIMVVPVSYLLLYYGYPPETTFYVAIVISIVALFSRLIILSSLVNLSIREYAYSVIFKVTSVALISLIPPIIVRALLPEGLNRLLLVSITSILASLISVYFIGMGREEQAYARNQLNKFKIRRE